MSGEMGRQVSERSVQIPTITLIALLVAIAFALIRAIKGPTVYDRILAPTRWAQRPS